MRLFRRRKYYENLIYNPPPADSEVPAALLHPNKEKKIMAVSVKTISTLDRNSGAKKAHNREVHYLKVGKMNRKGVAKAIGGDLHDHLGDENGDFHILLSTKVNGKARTLEIGKGDVVFQTGTSNRWQVLSNKGFKKRFPEAKI